MKSTIENLPTHLICFSHLRWDFVFQRPQHLLTRFSKDTLVYYFEEPVFNDISESYLSITKRGDRISVAVPHLPHNLPVKEITLELQSLLDKFFSGTNLINWTFWYYTPMAYSFTAKYKPRLIIYDCMDELSAFDFAPKELIGLEKKLLSKADLVFTGGRSLFESKKKYHNNIFSFPSSIDQKHFEQAKHITEHPDDQAKIEGPKIGFFGVIDERFDIELIKNIAEQRPNWQLILIGPVVKISYDILPRNKNIHYFGQKDYSQLPAYLSQWEVALIPFNLNKSTEFISPTKTPEYLAAGVPVVSTAIKDVVNPYGLKGLVHIGSTAKDFIVAIEKELNNSINQGWKNKVDALLKNISWDKTQASMKKQMRITLKNLNEVSVAS
jgi:glycosyltransferase involved in cell wall biosynthesis